MPLSRLQHSYSPSNTSSAHKPTSSTDHREAPAGSLSSPTTASSTLMNSTVTGTTSLTGTHNRISSLHSSSIHDENNRNRIVSTGLATSPSSTTVPMSKGAPAHHLSTNSNQPYDTSTNAIFPEVKTTQTSMHTGLPTPQIMLSLPAQQDSALLTTTTSSSVSSLTGALSSDYALRIVFEQFEKLADMKMSMILNTGVEIDLDLRVSLGEDSDPAFDKLIQSLAKLATTQQKPVIDAVMRWRKAKIEPLDPALVKRISEAAPLSRARDVQSILKERQSLASVYILCRTLIAIVQRFTPDALPDEQGENLEEIVFNQLKKADPEIIKRSRNRTASMDLFAGLIGELSNIRFASVSDRFIAELEKYNSHTIMKERQSHMEMLISGMRFLKIKIYPVDALEETADFLSSCAGFFKNSHGIKVKHAYSALFVQLLLPVAEVAVAEVNFPAWAKTVDLVYPRAWKMTLKPKHMMVAFPLVTTLLCVSRKEFFTQHWLTVLDSCYQKFNKDKYTRQMALGCVSRLTWTYLFRCTESTSTTFKKLDTIIKTIFPQFRRTTYPADVSLDHFILITYYALMRDVETAMNNIIYYLLNMDNAIAMGSTSNQTSSSSTTTTNAASASGNTQFSTTVVHWEYLSPERMIVAIRAFQLLLADLENNRHRPPFPIDTDMASTGLSSTFMACSADVLTAPIRAIKIEATDKMEDTMGKTLLSLDQSFGRLLVLDEKNIIHRPMAANATPSSSMPTSLSPSTSTTISPSSSSFTPPLAVTSTTNTAVKNGASMSLIVGNNGNGLHGGGGSFIGNSPHHHHYHSNSLIGDSSTGAYRSLTNTNYSVPLFANTMIGNNGSVIAPSTTTGGVGGGASDSSGPQVQYQYSHFSVSYSKDKQPYFELLKSILDAMPRLMPAGLPLPKVVEMLARYTVHIDPEVIQASSQALRRIAKQIDSQTVVTGYAKFIYRLEDRVSNIIVSLAHGLGNPIGRTDLDDSSGSGDTGSGLNTGGNSGGVLQLYVDLLAIWVNQVELGSLRELVMASPSPSLSADVQSDVTRLFNMVEETEANGLMFLCNQSWTVRRMALLMIQWAAKFEGRLESQVEAETHIITTSTASSSSDTVAVQQFIQQMWDYIDRKKTRTYRRLLDMLENPGVGQELIQFDKDKNQFWGTKLSIETRIRLQQLQRRTSSPILVQMATSDDPTDQWIWQTCFMELIKRIFVHFPDTVALCRQNICDRLLQTHPTLLASIETAKTGATGTLSMAKSNTSNHKVAVSTDLVDQWKVYLAFACATTSNKVIKKETLPVASKNKSGTRGGDAPGTAAGGIGDGRPMDRRSPMAAAWVGGGRKGSVAMEKLDNASDLFRLVLPFLPCDNRPIREGTIYGLGHIHPDAYKSLMNDLQSWIRVILDEGKHRNNQKPYQNKRNKKNDRLRISLMHVLASTASCLTVQKTNTSGVTVSEFDNDNKVIVLLIMSYIKETKVFLGGAEVQLEWEYHKLRVYLCHLVEQVYKVIMELDDPTSIMSFETRLSLYKMFEEWCGYGAYSNVTRARETAMIRDVLEQCKEAKDRASMTKLMEEERKALETAVLSAMAMLCRGPLYTFLGQKKARQAVIQFDMLNVLRWIDAVFESPDPKNHIIAREALEAVLVYNQDQPLLLDDIIEQCYAGNPKLEFTQGYFQAVSDIVARVTDYPCHVHQIMSLALFKAGDGKKAIRKSAIQLLRVVEERVFGDSCAKEYEIGITSSLPAIYKHTQTLLSARLAVDHPEQTYSMLSEITQRFEHISPNSQREVLGYMLPWLRKVDLTMVSGPNATSSSSTSVTAISTSSSSSSSSPGHNQETELSTMTYVVLSNLYYITIKFGDTYVKEIAALWNQLVDHGRNVRAIITYLLDMGLEKRNPWFLVHAKRVFVCLGRTPAFTRVVEEAIAEITPRSMVPQTKESSPGRYQHLNRHHAKIFVADTDKVLPPYAKRPAFSKGQLAMVYLVDMAIEAGADLAPHLPLLLHTIFVQLDHLTSIVCDQSRCLLINLIHAIVVRQSLDADMSKQGLDVIEWLASKEGKRLWAYENITPTKNRRLQSTQELKDLVQRVLYVFSHEDRDLRQKWGETALKWATCCSVRHIACRSFQCFRGLMPAFNQHMLADMLARLSNTVADKSEDIRGFSLEIILTLTDVARAMDSTQIEQFPQLFWAAVACLYSPFPSEHAEALALLEVVLNKLLQPSTTDTLLTDSFPVHWATEFDGLQPLLLKGLQFTMAEEKTWSLLRRIMLLDNLPLIDPAPTRFMYLLLGAIPRLLNGLDQQQENNNGVMAHHRQQQQQQHADMDDSGIGNSSTVANSATASLTPGQQQMTAFTDAVDLANDLAELAKRVGLTEVHRLLTTYPKQKAKFQMDYLKQMVGTLRAIYLMEQGNEALMFALLMIKNKLDYYRDKTLMLIEVLVPYVIQSNTYVDISTLSPLLQLVQTPFADRALSILNSGIPVLPHDHQQQSYDSTDTTLGSANAGTSTPTGSSPSGSPAATSNMVPIWRMDDIASTKMTRKNIHAVVFECSTITNQTPIEHNIQFSIEDFSLLTGDEKVTAVTAVAAGVMTTSPTSRSSIDGRNDERQVVSAHLEQQRNMIDHQSSMSVPSSSTKPMDSDAMTIAVTVLSDLTSPSIASSSSSVSSSVLQTTPPLPTATSLSPSLNQQQQYKTSSSMPHSMVGLQTDIGYPSDGTTMQSTTLDGQEVSASLPQHGEDLMNALKDLDDFFNEETENLTPSSSLTSFHHMAYDYTNGTV
ncbi:cell morphogenesis N-terminal-domain-containing protein [Chlamydoabsidia padenii]|nr:cell morphogenesis N-terminal-domain-containing protein [Chlamydoabsidia padenii]